MNHHADGVIGGSGQLHKAVIGLCLSFYHMCSLRCESCNMANRPEPVLPEPWMRGPIQGVDPLCASVLFSFQHAREDLARHTEGLSEAQLWATPYGFGSAGSHILHIAGSTERLMQYLQGRELSAAQLDALAAEPTA